MTAIYLYTLCLNLDRIVNSFQTLTTVFWHDTCLYILFPGEYPTQQETKQLVGVLSPVSHSNIEYKRQNEVCAKIKPETLSRIAQTTAASTRFRTTGAFLSVPRYDWCASLSYPCSCMLCESRTLTAKLQRIQAMEMRCYRKILAISFKDRVTKRGSLCQDPAGNRSSRRPPDHRKETQTEVVWTCLLFIPFRYGQNHLARHSERGKKTR